jgi:YD repeat-containing protein
MTTKNNGSLGRPNVRAYPKDVEIAGEPYVQVAGAAKQCHVTRGRIYQLVTEERMQAYRVRWDDEGRMFTRRHTGDRGQEGLLYVRADDVDRYQKYQDAREELLAKAIG